MCSQNFLILFQSTSVNTLTRKATCTQLCWRNFSIVTQSSSSYIRRLEHKTKSTISRHPFSIAQKCGKKTLSRSFWSILRGNGISVWVISPKLKKISKEKRKSLKLSETLCFSLKFTIYPKNTLWKQLNSRNIFGNERRAVGASVVANFWARVLCSLAAEDACFRMSITLGVVLIRSLVCAKCVPGRVRSGSGVALI